MPSQRHGSNSASVRVPRINSRFPDILLIFPHYQLFRHLKTLPEYAVKRQKLPIFSLHPAEEISFFSGNWRVEAWRLKMFTTLLAKL
jgi:hypothetical protein